MSIDDDTITGYFRDDEPGDIETPDDGPAPDITDADQVQALGRCDWHLRRIGRLTRERDTLDAVYAAELDRLMLWYSTQRERIEGRIAWNEAPLKSFAAMRRETAGEKTIALPHGTIRSTARPGRVRVIDPDAVGAWAKDVLPDVVEWRPHIDKRHLTAYVQASGEVPPGVTVTPPTTTYHVTAEGGEL